MPPVYGNKLPVLDTFANLTAADYIYPKNQVIQETDTGVEKVGDGITSYNNLGFYESNPGVMQEYTPASGTDTYVATFKMYSIKGYFTGLRLRVKFTNANTGASTINLNGFGAKAIKKNVSTALASGDILAGSVHDITYDGTNFQVSNGVSSAGVVPTLSQVLTAGNNATSIGIINLGDIVNTSGSNVTTYYNSVPGYWQLYAQKGATYDAYYEAATDNGTDPYLFLAVNQYGTRMATTLEIGKNLFNIEAWPGQAFPGATYDADYSANYTTRSLVDKAYVDGLVTAGYVPTSRTLTINGSAQDLSANRTWTITTTGTANRITVSGGTGLTPTIDIAATYVGQTSITTLGTITTGTWNATLIGTQYGGTGANNSGATVGAIPYYSSGTVQTFLAATATAGKHLQSGASAAPTWTTATFPSTATGTGTILRADGTNWVASTNTYPNTTAVNQILFATSANVIGGSTTLLTDGSFLYVGGTAAISGEVWSFQKNQNAVSQLIVSNSTSGTAARASLFIASDSTLGFSLNACSGSFTTSGMQIANTSVISSSQTAGFNFGTATASQMSFWTNDTKRMILSSTGIFTIGIGTGSVPTGTLLDVQTGTTGGAVFGGNASGARAVKIFQDASGFAYIQGISRTDSSARDLSLQLDGSNLLIAGTASRATTAGVGILSMFNGTAPVGTLANGISLFSASGKLKSIDAAGTSGWVLSSSAVTTVNPTAPNRTLTVEHNGTTYYLACKTTND